MWERSSHVAEKVKKAGVEGEHSHMVLGGTVSVKSLRQGGEETPSNHMAAAEKPAALLAFTQPEK